MKFSRSMLSLRSPLPSWRLPCHLPAGDNNHMDKHTHKEIHKYTHKEIHKHTPNTQPHIQPNPQPYTKPNTQAHNHNQLHDKRSIFSLTSSGTQATCSDGRAAPTPAGKVRWYKRSSKTNNCHKQFIYDDPYHINQTYLSLVLSGRVSLRPGAGMCKQRTILRAWGANFSRQGTSFHYQKSYWLVNLTNISTNIETAMLPKL